MRAQIEQHGSAPRTLPSGAGHGAPKLPVPYPPQGRLQPRQKLTCASAPPSSSDVRLADTTAAPVELAITDSHPSSTYIGSDPSFESTSVEEGWPHSNGSGNGSAPSVAVAPEVLERMQSGEEASTSAYVEEVVEYSRVEELLSKGNRALSLAEIEGTFKFPLDGFQRDAVVEFLKGNSVVVCAPTGAGKTAIAEAATIAVLARGERVIYTTPLKALSNQKLHEMRAQFGFDRVGLQTGDGSLNSEGDVVIMTTEVLRNILFRIAADDEDGTAEGGRMTDVGLVVLDEVHYLGDPDRGSVWEEVIISCPRSVPLICMSATVQNPGDLGGWISKVHGDCETIITDFRPIPLHWGYCYNAEAGAKMLPLMEGKGKLAAELQRATYIEPQFEQMKLNEQRKEEEMMRRAMKKHNGKGPPPRLTFHQRAKPDDWLMNDLLASKVRAFRVPYKHLHGTDR